MIIDKALSKRLKKLLPKNYRQIIVDRLKQKGTTYHPNTIRNVLNGSPNLEVAEAIVELCNEKRKSLSRFNRRAHAILETAA
jgi:hypothetical protein